MLAPWKKRYDKSDSEIKRRDITLPTKVLLVKAMVFPVVMYGWESRTIKKAEHQRIDTLEVWCWRRSLRVPWAAKRSNQSILKEVNPKYTFEGLMLKLKLQYFGHLMQRADSFPWCWERLKTEGGDDKEEMVGWHHQLNGHESEQTPGDGEGQESLVCYSPWGCKESYTTERLNKLEARQSLNMAKICQPKWWETLSLQAVSDLGSNPTLPLTHMEVKWKSHSPVRFFVTPWTTAHQVIYLIYLNFNSQNFFNRDTFAYFMDKKCVYTMYIVCRNVYRQEMYIVWSIKPRNMLPNIGGTNYMWLFKSNLDRLKLNKISI